MSHADALSVLLDTYSNTPTVSIPDSIIASGPQPASTKSNMVLVAAIRTALPSIDLQRYVQNARGPRSARLQGVAPRWRRPSDVVALYGPAMHRNECNHNDYSVKTETCNRPLFSEVFRSPHRSK